MFVTFEGKEREVIDNAYPYQVKILLDGRGRWVSRCAVEF